MTPAMPQRRATLPMIIAAARAGSLDLATTLFEQGGFAQRTDDPAALAVRARLLKDRARLRPPAERARAFAEAAGVYAAADALAAQPYTRLNVATLTLLSGDAPAACTVAKGLLDWLESGADLAETAYFIEATRAEALLVCGEREACEAALDTAMALNPENWEDHATTVRQFEMILAEQRRPTGWLDRFRPPRSLHFIGHLGIDAHAHRSLSHAVEAVIESETIGFASSTS